MPALTTHAVMSSVVTFLVSDIEGSTRLWEAQPEAMPAALARHDTLLRTAIDAAGGTVFKTGGDSFHAVFENPHSALDAALRAQTALVQEPWQTRIGAELRVRLVLHTGQAERRGGDYFGASLSRTARLLSAAHGGQTLLSEAAAAQVRGRLPEGVRLHSLGQHRLKDLAQPQEIFQVCAPALPGEFPPLRSLGSFSHNLPGQMTSFIGRETETAAVQGQLAKHRLVTLTGTGGSGKTRLALQVAADLLGRYADGIWLVELAALAETTLLPQAVAEVLGIREESEKEVTRTVVDALRQKSLLLILDNCEHLVSDAARLAETLLQACPKLTILATSREALEIGGEAVLPLSPLGLPPPGSVAPAPDALERCEAVRLFVDRATEALPTFRFSAGNAAAVVSVCTRLDGNPLALELAAARIKVLTPEQIDGRLGDRFRLLSGGSRTALPRQQTLRALLDWSYDLLTPAEQCLLRRLSVFPGGWSLETAETVCAGGAITEESILDGLSRLVAKSLVVVEPPVDGQVRYHLLESIRSYSGEQMALASGEAQALACRHRDYFLAFAEDAEPHLTGPDQALWLNRLERDLDNLRAALAFGREANDLSLPRLAGALSRFWYGRSYLTEGLRWLNAALAEMPTPTGTMLGKVLNGAGMLSRCCGDCEMSHIHHTRDLAIRRETGDRRGIARALGSLCLVACTQKQWSLAETYGQQSLAHYQALGDEAAGADLLTTLGGLAFFQKNYSEAERLYREALVGFERAHDAVGNSDALHNLGDLFAQQGRYDRAKPYFRESLSAQRTLGNKQRIASTVRHLAEIASAEEDHFRASLLGAAADSLMTAYGLADLPTEHHYQAALDRSRAALETALFLRAESEGHTLNAGQVIDFVMQNYAALPQNHLLE